MNSSSERDSYTSDDDLLDNEGNYSRESFRKKKKFLRLISREEHKVVLMRHNTPYMSKIKSWYHSMLDLSWWKLLIGFLAVFMLIHIVFGWLYFLDWPGVQGVDSDNTLLLKFFKCFCLSVQTLSTIGFGFPLAPVSVFAQSVVVLEAFLGFIYTAILTATAVTKISRPTRLVRRILFSEVAVINQVSRHFFVDNKQTFDHGYLVVGRYPVLSFRIANTRKSMLADPNLRVYLLRRESEDGSTISQLKRRHDGVIPPKSRVKEVLHELDFELNNQIGRPKTLSFAIPHLALPWTISHTLSPNSPLYGLTEADLDEDPDNLFEIICVLDGIDESVSMSVEGRWSYLPHEIMWNTEFKRMTRSNFTRGMYEVDYQRLSHYEVVAEDERIEVMREKEKQRVASLNN